MHIFAWADQDWIGRMIFKNFVDQDRIGFNFIGSGLDSDCKISQSTHLWWLGTVKAAISGSGFHTVLNMFRSPDRDPTGFCTSEPDPDWILKKTQPDQIWISKLQ